MKEHQYIDEECLIRDAVNLLLKELGPVETMRFLSLDRKKKINSVMRHRRWQEQLNENEFLDKVFGDK